MKRRFFSAFFAVFLGVFSVFAQTSSGNKTVCRNITAVQTEVNKIKITWKLPDHFQAASIAVFRSTKPLHSISSISETKPVAELPANTSSYTDTVSYFDEYYYALLARDRDGNLQYNFFPSVNTTATPIKISRPDIAEYNTEEITEPSYQAGQLRGLPLPYLAFFDDYTRPPTKLSQKTVKAGKTLAGKYATPKTRILPIYVFEEDLECAPNGDDYYLFQSLKKYFIKKDYKNSVLDLKKFLGINRSPSTTNRALFYLAESQYFCKNYRQALEIFLYLEDEYPDISKKWIDSTLDNYRIPEEFY